MRRAIAFVWLCTGFSVLHPAYREVGEAYLALTGFPTWTMYAACIGEVLLGFAVLLRPPSAGLTFVQIALISGFTAILGAHAPLLFAHPFGVLIKNIPLVTLLLCAWFVHRDGWTLTSEWLLRVGMASIWITEGLFPKILFQQPMELAVVAGSGLVPGDPAWFLVVMGVAQIGAGIAALSLRGRLLTWILWLQLVALGVLPVLVALQDSTLWVHPFGPLTKNVPIIVGTVIVLLRVTPFLAADWSHILVVTFAVPPALLESMVPVEVELDTRNGHGFISFVSLEFSKTNVLGLPCYGMRSFLDVNLRYYVSAAGRPGVVFIRELVPIPLVAWVARVMFREPFSAAKVSSCVISHDTAIEIHRTIQTNRRSNSIHAVAVPPATAWVAGSDAEFFLERYWGFRANQRGELHTFQVTHDPWRVYAIESYQLDIDWLDVYGKPLGVLNELTPYSVELAEGSPVAVWFPT